MFLSRATNSLDAKGRISVPADFRAGVFNCFIDVFPTPLAGVLFSPVPTLNVYCCPKDLLDLIETFFFFSRLF